MVESRTVLGAAVADDVIGLVILTVVVRLVTSGSVSALSVLWIVFVAVAFLAVTAYVGVRFVPGFFDWIARQSRSSGTLVAIALAFTLAIAELAERGQARADRRGVRRRARPRSKQLVRSHPKGAAAGRTPLHPGLLLDHRHRGRRRAVCEAVGARNRGGAVRHRCRREAGRGGRDDRLARRPNPRRDRHDPARRGRFDLRDHRLVASDHRPARLRGDLARRAPHHTRDPTSAAITPGANAKGRRDPRRARRRRDPKGDGSR